MPQWKKNVYVVWLAIFISSVCWTMVMPFTPVYLEQLGVTHSSEFWSGLIIAVSSVCGMVMAPIWGAIGDRYGRRMMMLRAGIFLILGYVLMALVQGPFQLMWVRIMIALLTGFTPMAVALVGVSTPRQEVGRALSLVQTAFPSGTLIGPVVGGVLSDWIGIRGACWASGAMIAFAMVLAVVLVKEDFTPSEAGKSNVLGELKAAASHRLLISIVLISVISQAAIQALEPVLVPFVQQISGGSAAGWVSGLIYSLPGITYILVAPLWARRGERIGFERTIALGMLVSMGLYALQAFAGNPWQLGGLRLFTGVANGAIDPGVAALLATAVPRELGGRAFGLNQAANSAGAIVGPLLGGWIASYVNPRGVFLMIALFYVIGYLWTRRVVGPQVRAAAASSEEMGA